MARKCQLNGMFADNKQFKEFMETGNTNSASIRRFKKLLMAGIDTMLTDRQRYCVTLYYIKNVPQKEIARTLGVNPSTVTRSIRSALNRLSIFANLL